MTKNQIFRLCAIIVLVIALIIITHYYDLKLTLLIIVIVLANNWINRLVDAEDEKTEDD